MDIEERIKDLESIHRSVEFKLKELKEELEEKKRQEEAEKLKPWKPVCGDLYYSIDNDGEVCEDNWGSANYDMACFEIGNCFKTREEAEFTVERLKVIQELKQFARSYKDNEDNWLISYDYKTGELWIYYNDCRLGLTLYFESEDKAREAIKAVGEDRVKKYYLGVKEI